MDKQQLRKIIEGALLAFAQPLTVDKLYQLFVDYSAEQKAKREQEAANEDAQSGTDADQPQASNLVEIHSIKEGLEESLEESIEVTKENIIEALNAIQNDCDERGFELVEVASGWRFQVRAEVAPWVNKLWEEKPQKYSRALLETLAIIAYRQPITRGDIEEIRGVAVSSHIIKTLVEREWIKVVGQRDVPGRPSLYATTKQFLDYFNLQSLEQLPSLRELTDIEALTPELNFADVPPVEDTDELPSSAEDPDQDREPASDNQQEEAPTDLADDAAVMLDETQPEDELAADAEIDSSETGIPN